MGEKIEEYSDSNIKVLEGLEAVRKRPGMYIGDTGITGLHHMIWEVVDNSADEALAGHGDTIDVEKTEKEEIIVRDYGRGIPVGINEQTGLSTVETVMTVLHAGGKFDADSYKVSGGLHGVGVSVVTALSEWIEAEVFRDGQHHKLRIEDGGVNVTQPLEVVGKVKKSETGTKISFKSDPLIFKETTTYDDELIKTRLRRSSFLTPGVKYNYTYPTEEGKETETFYSENGLTDYIDYVFSQNPENVKLTENYYVEKEGEFDDTDKTKKNVKVKFAFSYGKDYHSNVLSFVNNIPTSEGGPHETQMFAAMRKAIGDKAKEKKLDKKLKGFSADDIKEGLNAIVAVYVYEPQFEGQTKGKLGKNTPVSKAVYATVKDNLEMYLEENPKVLKMIVQKVELAKKAREASERSREATRKSEEDSMVGILPTKLADCRSKNPEECEIFLVEGDSAAGCFSGDTLISLADSREITLKELAKEFDNGKENFIYTFNKEKNEIELAPIKNCWKTKTTNDLLILTIDNGEEVICTPEHKFLLKNGNYVEAKYLKSTDSLMPLYRKISKKGKNGQVLNGYEYVIQPDNKKEYTHQLADKLNIKNFERDGVEYLRKNYARHHIDFNKRNNNPTNIVRMNSVEHIIYDQNQIKKTLHTEESRKKQKIAMRNPELRKEISKRSKELWEKPSYREKYEKDHHKKIRLQQELDGKLNKEALKLYWLNETNKKEQSKRVKKYFKENPEKRIKLSEMAKKQWEDKELLEWRRNKTKEQMSNPENIKKKLNSERITRINNTLSSLNIIGIDNYEEFRKGKRNIYKIDTMLKYFYLIDRNIDSLDKFIKSDFYTYNHKVIKIEKYKGEPIDVFDIEVETTHNFALSAGFFVHNSAKNTRDNIFQAILPLKGKVLNAFKNSLQKVLKNNEVGSLITAIGAGHGKDFDIDKVRYHKVIIMTDADIDGGHIGTLLVLAFMKLMRPLVEAGYLYVVIPPLHRVSKGDKSYYFFSDKARTDFFIDLWKKSNKGDVPLTNKGEPNLEVLSKGWIKTRFKGLGEMNPDQLEETSINPETRILKQLIIPENKPLLEDISTDNSEELNSFLEENGDLTTNELINEFEIDDILEILGGEDSSIRRWFLMKYTNEIEVDV